MFQKILLPVDLADRHQPALEMAAKLAKPGASIVTLLHVIETISELSSGEDQDFYKLLQAAAQTFLNHLGAQLDERKVSWNCEILFGHRALEAVRYAAERGTDLIILTAPQIDPANPGANWGSLSYKISILSKCPVLMVKGTD